VAVRWFHVYRTKRRFVEGNLEGVSENRSRRGAQLTGKEASLAGGDGLRKTLPRSRRWTLELLATHGQVTGHEAVGETVRRRLAENASAMAQDMWCIQKSMAIRSPAWKTSSTSMPEAPDPDRPVVCFDESPSSSSARSASRFR